MLNICHLPDDQRRLFYPSYLFFLFFFELFFEFLFFDFFELLPPLLLGLEFVFALVVVDPALVFVELAVLVGVGVELLLDVDPVLLLEF